MTLPRRIFKYPFPLGATEIRIPYGSTVLHVGLQHDLPTIWAAVPVVPQGEPIRVILVATGDDEPPPNFRHIGTVVGVSEVFVLHAYLEVA